MTPRASIVIPLYNRCDLTLPCLEAIERHTPEHLYEVVLVDNASTDATSELLDALEGDVTVIRNAENLGFAKACNQGAAAARGEVLFFLNNDTEVCPGWLEPVLAVLDAEPGVGATGSFLRFPDGRVQHAGMILVRNESTGQLEAHNRCLGYPGDAPEARAAFEPSAVTGAALAVRARAFAEVGGFDEGYWNGYEDVDLCLRLRADGWRIAYVPASAIVHHESASGPERYSGITAGGARFTERWGDVVHVDAVRDDAGARAPDAALARPVAEPHVAGALARLAQRAARQHGAPTRFAGRDAALVAGRLLADVDGDPSATERVLDRASRVEERRLLDVVRAGRDVCWVDDGEDEPLVTIAIPTYRRGQMVADRAIASALAQTYDRIEVLVVGDRCDEATERAVRSVQDPRVRFFNLPARGIYPADPKHRWMVAGTAPANLAIELAAGAWITQCDDDDELTPDHVEVLLSFARQERAELVYSQATMEVAPGRWATVGSAPLREGAVTHGSVLYSLGLRFFRYSPTAWKLEEPGDWNLWRRMAEAGVRISFLPAVTYVHYLETLLRSGDEVEVEAPLAAASPTG